MTLIVVLGALAFTAPPAQAIPGDLYGPILNDGDWWNYTLSRSTSMPSQVGDYGLEFKDSRGWLRYEVDGTTSHMDNVAWVMKVTGVIHLTGDWHGVEDSGTASMDANVSGTEWRGINDLAYLGSTLSYNGGVEIATMEGPEYFNITLWENTTLSAPLRMMLFPVPVAQFPEEHHEVHVTVIHQTDLFARVREEAWEYNATYRGLADVQGEFLTFNNQHRFDVLGNITVDEETTPIDSSLYFETMPRKAVTVDLLLQTELVMYHVDQTTTKPDLLVAQNEFIASHPEPTEGIEVNFSLVVHNLGTNEVLDIQVQLWASFMQELPSQVNGTTIFSIPGQDSVRVHFNWSADEIGPWKFFVRADPFNTISEVRETNNEASMELEVVPFAPRANLFMEPGDTTLDPPSPLQNRTAVSITTSVHNEGPGDAYNVTVDWFLGRPGSGGIPIGGRETIEFIPAEESRSVSIFWVADVPGTQEIWAYVDQNNTVNESVETDNVGSVSLIIIASPSGGVDLVVARIGWFDTQDREVTQLPRGERSTIEVTIANQGPNNATRIHLSLYLDDETPAGLVGSHEGSIDAGTHDTWRVTWVVDGDNGPHNLIAKVLALGEVDADFDDNLRMLEMAVGPKTTPEPELLDVTLFPDANNLQPGQRIEVSGKVTRSSNGFEVMAAEVSVFFVGSGQPVVVTTNELGRYLAEIEAPNKPGTYRLEVQVAAGLSEGEDFVSITVEDNTINIDGGRDGDDSGKWFLFVIIIVIVLAVGMPLTYYFLLSQEAIQRRIRRVHEEIVEIVEEEKK
jgi:hypothetical protein